MTTPSIVMCTSPPGSTSPGLIVRPTRLLNVLPCMLDNLWHEGDFDELRADCLRIWQGRAVVGRLKFSKDAGNPFVLRPTSSCPICHC